MNENKKAKNKKLLVGGIFALIVAVVAIVAITLNVKNTEKASELEEILDKDLEDVGELDFAITVFNDIAGIEY